MFWDICYLISLWWLWSETLSVYSILMVWFGGRPSLQQRFTSQEPILNKHYSVPCKRDALYQFSFSSYKRNRKGNFFQELTLACSDQSKINSRECMEVFFSKSYISPNDQANKWTNKQSFRHWCISEPLRACYPYEVACTRQDWGLPRFGLEEIGASFKTRRRNRPTVSPQGI